jgi:hypothetical protein
LASIINASNSGFGGVVTTGDSSGILTLQTAGTTAVTIDTSQRAAFVAGTAALPAITTAGDTNTGMFFPAADTIAFAEGGAESMRIDSSGNVGIGTTSPTTKLQVNGGMTMATANWFSYGTDNTFYSDSSYGLVIKAPATSNFIAFRSSNDTERMRIDSNGNVLVGTTSGGSGKLRVSGASDSFATSYTSPSAGYFFSSNSADTTCVEIYQGRYNRAGLALSANNTGTVTQIDFYQTGTARGSISTNNSTTAYNTSSDYRLKDNIVPMTGALDKVALLKPVTYTWKQDGSDGQGFIAHELQAVIPDAVVGEKDAVETYTDEDGIEQTRIKPQGIDTSFLVATLTAAIQEQQTIINDLKARVEALEAK